MNAMTIATNWKRNREIIEDWMKDYGRRMGKSRNDIVAERQANYIHDERMELAGYWEGYEMRTVRMDDGKYRYTVITPWGMNEGLCDLDRRDDAKAASLLYQVIDNI